ncbi:MAG: M15 family metallopeptidase, partial [Acidothermales bacterium]|nr:M15 family metallopeptidase [Acidothermales bacterium]
GSGPFRQAADPSTGTPSSGAASVTPTPGGTVRPLGARRTADLLIRNAAPLPPSLRDRIRHADGVATTLTFAVGTAKLAGRTVSVAAVDPSTFRSYAPLGTAESDPLWASVARGDLAVAHRTASRLHLALGAPVRFAGRDARVGAFATTLPGIDVVVDAAQAGRLGLRRDTGMVASVGRSDPGAVGQRVTALVARRADVDLLTAPTAIPRSFVTGGAASKAFGTFSYRYSANGTITPDPAWVRANVRTESVPILGRVTCHRLMFPQLRGALNEVVSRGLAGAIHRGQYGGCYVPRFIESNPNRPISLHTWGIAIDLNVPGNQRGTSGRMNRQVVAIFKKWGFTWGGDWQYTDPMHFEISALMQDPP